MTQHTRPTPDIQPACCDKVCSSNEAQNGDASAIGNGRDSAVLYIPAMDCAVEEGEIRQALDGINGIRSLNFQLTARTLSIEATSEALPLALEAIRQSGFDSKPLSSADSASSEQGHINQGLWRLGVALILAIGAEALAYFTPDTMLFKGLGMLMAAAAIGFAGFSTYSRGFVALRNGRLNINALMTVAVTGAFLIGQWPEAAMVMALYAIAELIEARSVDRARNAIKGLLDLTPDTAEVRQPDGSWIDVPATEVTLDALVRVKPGARIPLDGVVTSGNSAVNQAPVTGESIPVDKSAGDMVFAGTINETGALEFRVTAAANNTTLARIIHTVEQAQGARACADAALC